MWDLQLVLGSCVWSAGEGVVCFTFLYAAQEFSQLSWVSLLVESSLTGYPGDPCSSMQYLEQPLPAATWV